MLLVKDTTKMKQKENEVMGKDRKDKYVLKEKRQKV